MLSNMKISLLFIAVTLVTSLTLVSAQSSPPASSPLPTEITPVRRSRKEVCRAYDIGGLCKCDSDCDAYGDCCGPSPTQRPRGCDGTVRDAHLEGLQFTCRSIFLSSEVGILMKHEAFWMVSQCSSDWLMKVGDSGQMVSEGCTNEARDLPPVTDNNTGIIYKNEHCALCNYVEDIVPWSTSIMCTPDLYDLLETTPISKINVSLFEEQCRPCSYLRPDIDHSVPPPRACYPTDTCFVEKFRNASNVPRQCQLNLPIIPKVTTPPPKPALTSMTEDLNHTIKSRAYRLHSPIVYACSEDLPTAGSISFVITFSPFIHGGLTIANKTMSFRVPFKCPQGKAPIGFNKCIKTICPDGYNNNISDSVDGRCHAINDGNQSTNESVDCSTGLVPLNGTEYTKLSNETVLVDGIMMKEILGYRDGIPLICPNMYNSWSILSYPAGFLELTYVGCSLSVIGSALVLITYGLFKELRSVPSKILMNLAFANLMTNLLLLIGSPLTQAFPITQLCTAIAILLHFFFLVQFAWMSVMSFDVVRKFSQARKLIVDSKRNELSLIVIYVVVGWGLPLLISTVSIVVNFTTTGLVLYGVLADGSLNCWINHFESAVIAFLVPLVLALSFNLVMFVTVIFYIRMVARSRAKLKREGGTPLLHLSIAIFCTTGLTWIFGFIAILARTSWVWYPFIIFNSTQGFIIFVAFLFTKKTLKLYISCLTCKIVKKDMYRSPIKESSQLKAGTNASTLRH